ncbi:hypothetical protein Salat_0764500 [Sesamum alatum]|uniref:Uncharacterized protein n=1 Tax=Sesamum alatum TaxID=300844 RepID=A0AAE2CVK0_9LAMI|nr:hypothetical protein Salat_0764500 [Sesamum alatum]
MLVEESLLGETLIDSKDNMHVHTLDEAYETLSLCDLPLYSDQSADWDQDFSLAQSHASTSSEHDCFEFFSQELDPSGVTTAPDTTTVFPRDNIMFCGKLIPYKQTPSPKKDSSSVVKNKKRRHCWGSFRWKFNSDISSKKQVRSKNRSKSATLMHKNDCMGLYELPKKTYNSTNLGHKMPILTSSSSGKLAKWHLFLFGISRFSTEVELRDIKSRQITRRQCPSPPPLFKFQNGNDEVISGERNGGWGLWGLICGGNRRSTTKAVAAVGVPLPE